MHATLMDMLCVHSSHPLARNGLVGLRSKSLARASLRATAFKLRRGSRMLNPKPARSTASALHGWSAKPGTTMRGHCEQARVNSQSTWSVRTNQAAWRKWF